MASDENRGGYDGLKDVGIQHLTVRGLKSSLSPLRLWHGMHGLRRLLRHETADVVWFHARLAVVFGRLLLALRLWRPAARTRIVVTYHGLPFGPGHRPGMAGLSKWLERGLLRFCPALDLVFLTQTQADHMSAVMGGAMARHRIHVLPNSSNLGALPSAVHGPGRHLVMTGRCGWQKNYPLALRIFAELPGDFTLTLCGAGTQTPAFQAEAAKCLTPEAMARVRFAGPLRDVRPVLAAADGYLLCSRYEGLPIGALEAFEAGLPLILSHFDGAGELASTHPMALTCGFDDLKRDAARMVDLIEAYTADREAQSARIRAAWAKHWSRELFATRVQALFAELLSAPPT